MQTIRDDVKANTTAIRADITTLRAEMTAFRDDMTRRLQTLEDHDIAFDPRFTALRRDVTALNERSVTTDGKVNTIHQSLTANSHPINLNQRLQTIDTSLTVMGGQLTTANHSLTELNTISTTANNRLDTIRLRFVDNDGNHINLNQHFRTIDDHVAAAAVQVNRIHESLVPANGIPIDMNHRLNGLQDSLDELDGRSAAAANMLATIQQSVTDDNNQPIDLNQRLTNNDQNSADTFTRLTNISQTLNATNGAVTPLGGVLENLKLEVRAG